MRTLQMCNMSQLKNSINGLNYGRSKLCSNLTSQGNFTALCRVNFSSHSCHNERCQFTNKLRQERITLRRRPLPRFAMAMERMEITDEQIFQEKQRVEQEETILGKDEVPEVAEANPDEAGPKIGAVGSIRIPDFGASKNGVRREDHGMAEANPDDAEPKIGAVGSELRECWDLWQRIGLPVEKIAKQRHMTETGVFYCIFTCIQNNYMVDWYELCKEAQFTIDIAKRMIQATEKCITNTNGGPVDSRTLRQSLPADVAISIVTDFQGAEGHIRHLEISEVHFGLFATMLVRGLPFKTIVDVSFQTGGPKPEMEWGEEYADEERFPKDVTEDRLLQWFAEKDGASLIEIALKFRECDDLELMRLILKLERDGKIFWRQGIFRVL